MKQTQDDPPMAEIKDSDRKAHQRAVKAMRKKKGKRPPSPEEIWKAAHKIRMKHRKLGTSEINHKDFSGGALTKDRVSRVHLASSQIPESGIPELGN